MAATENAKEMIVIILKTRCEKHNTALKREMYVVNEHKKILDLKQEFACTANSALSMEFSSSETSQWTQIDTTLFDEKTVTTILGPFGCKFIRVCCTDTTMPPVKKLKIEKSAFDVLMTAQQRKALPPALKTSSNGVAGGLSRKDELFNDLVKTVFMTRHLTGPDPDSISYIVQVLTNALWYVTNKHSTINDAAQHRANVLRIPQVFERYQHYNDVKKKKIKALPLQQTALDSRAQALYSVCTRPCMSSTPAWNTVYVDIKALADCFTSYIKHLKEQSAASEYYRNLDHPVRTVSEGCTVRAIPKSVCAINKMYMKLNTAVVQAGLLQPVMFDELAHLDLYHFENSMQRHRFVENLQLTVPVDLYKYSPGGSATTVIFVVQVAVSRTEHEKLTDVAQIITRITPQLPEFHTRAMKMNFKKQFANIANVKPSVVDFMYAQLAVDASAADHVETQQRLNAIFLGATGLLTDLRHLNAGRPSGKYDTFFEKMERLIDGVTAADERRHGVAHLSEWLSMKDLMKQCTELCPEGTAIPSHTLVRLQFTPRNPYVHAALNFTSKLNIQYKIQKRQLRVAHPDDHYCAAIFKFIKHVAVTFGDEAELYCCDDKAKVPFGEPGVMLSTGVRGKKTLAPVQSTLSAADHDMNSKASLTPSVYLKCQVPSDPDGSFYRGCVTVTVNDSVLQTSNPFRHAAALVKQIYNQDKAPTVLLRYSDGGTDYRNTLECVKCSLICLFRELNLDMLIAARCAPGQSWSNPAERVMATLNIGLQNCALERQKGSEEVETKLKKCTSMAAIREACKTDHALADSWSDIVKPVQALVSNRFSRLALKNEPIRIMDTVSIGDIEGLKRHLTEMFPPLDITKLQKQHTRKVAVYNEWLDVHCHERTYFLQIRKCANPACCLPVKTTKVLHTLPDPVLDASKEHYKPFLEVYGKETTSEEERPTFQMKPKSKTAKVPKESAEVLVKGAAKTPLRQTNVVHVNLLPPSEVNKLQGDTASHTAQNARYICECVECRKPRLAYSKSKLTEREMCQLAILMSEYDYTCGAPLTPPGHPLHGKVLTKLSLTCQSEIETPYYSSSLGRSDICYYCGGGNATIDQGLKKHYKTVFPICEACTVKWKPACMRPYGKVAKK